MVDRVEKLDPGLYRVQQAGDDRRRQQEEQEGEKKKKEKDKFEKKGAGWKKLIPGSTGVRNPLLAGRPSAVPHGVAGASIEQGEEEKEEESSLTFSEKILVAWGILDRLGRPRIPVLFAYLLVMALITVGSLLMIGFVVWR